jgi:hypothetical protein
MLTIPQRLVPREHVWGACRRPPDVGLRERESRPPAGDGRQECSGGGPLALSGRGDQAHLGTGVQRGRAARAGAGVARRAADLTDRGARRAGARGGTPLPPGRGVAGKCVDHDLGAAR